MSIAPIIIVAIVILAVGVVWASVKTIDQAHVGVVTLFGKYRRTLNPGLNFVIPLAEKVHWKVPVQNQTSQLQFAAITNDQASVHFTATIIFAVTDHQPETIQLVAFKFINYDAFNIAMTSAVEASVREFVATKKQADVLGLRTEIASHAKETLNQQLGEYGYTLLDLAINDITFDPEVMASMSRVVAATNSQTAAEFEGKALLIKRTKEAEANGAFIRIGAENEAAAAKLRGQGLADFRTELSKGLAASAWRPYAGQLPLILQSSLVRPDDAAREQVTTPLEAVRLGADALAVVGFVRGATEAAYLRAVADTVREAARFELPVICHIYPRDATGKIVFVPEEIAWAVRCAVEVGADIVKVPYCGDVQAYAEIVSDSPVPVVAAGGPQAESLPAALAMMADVVRSGARGATIGRNIWGFDQITAAVQAFKAVIHDGRTAAEALQIAGLVT